MYVKLNNKMECCILCLELNKDLLGSIKTNSPQWQELGITEVLEKHFWTLNTIQLPYTWICLSCWQEIDKFHKFYLRIEKAHMHVGRIKVEVESQLLEPSVQIIEEIKDISYSLEPEVLVDQIELQTVDDIKQYSVKEEEYIQDLNANNMLNKDPLKKSISPKLNIKISQTGPNQKALPLKAKKETPDSDNECGNLSDEDNNCGTGSDKSPTECKNRKMGDKFIADHFKQMFCDICDVSFVNFSAMKKHFLLTHSIQNGYLVCCNKKFYQRNHLVDHLQCHLNPDHFKCTQCDKILSDRKNLQGHILRVHRPEDVVAKHSCEICGKSFTMAYNLRSHKLTHLAEKEKKFKCSHCGKFYASPYLLKIHTEVIHLKKQAKVCYICGKTLGTSTDYKVHMNKHEGIPAPVINCDICGLRLSCDRSLKIHKESQHPVGGKRDHPCPFCNKVSPTDRALKKHIKTMHEKGCDYKCTLCEKAFRRPNGLKEHLASHTGTPLYTCPWCPKTFNSNSNMHAHRKNKHPKEYLELKLQRYN